MGPVVTMRETQRNTFNRRVGDLLIASASVLLGIVFIVRVPSLSPPDPEPVKVDTWFFAPRRVPQPPPPVFDVSETYYRTIIDNNLFRPLGWTPPRPIEPYRLLGTKLATDANTPPQAIIQTTAGQQTYIVSIGDKIDPSTEVVLIEGKQVTLSRNGQQRTLRLNTAIYLNPSPATRLLRRTINIPRRPTPTPVPVNRARPTEMPTPPKLTERYRPPPLSEWQTPEGIPIHLGDARLKNPVKWGLRRR